MAVGQQLSILAIDFKGLAATLIAKVGARKSIQALVREYIKKPKVDDIQRGLFTKVTQALLSETLALERLSVSCWVLGKGRNYSHSRWQRWF